MLNARSITFSLIWISLVGCSTNRVAGPDQASKIPPIVLRALETSDVKSGPAVVAQVIRAGRINSAIVGTRVVNDLEGSQQQPLELAFTVHPNGGTRNDLKQKEIGSANTGKTMMYQLFCDEPDLGWTPRNGVVDSLYHINPGFITGGHKKPPVSSTPEHDFSNTASGRPVGKYDVTSGPTSGAGMFGPTRYTANIASGEEHVVILYRITEFTSACNDGMTALAQFRAIVEVPGLVRIPNDPDIELDTYSGSLTSHDENLFWYLTPETIESTVKLARAYRDTFKTAMKLSAAALIQGGINDVSRNWAPPHHEHRIGTDVDVDDHLGNRDQELFRRVARIGGRLAGFKSCKPEDGDKDGSLDHVHCRLRDYE